jgi:hypothetical protein
MPFNHEFIIYELYPQIFSTSSKVKYVLYEILSKYDMNWESIDYVEKAFNILYKDHSNEFNIRISGDTTVSIDYIKKNLDKPWIWYYVSKCPQISYADILNNPDLPWVYADVLISSRKFNPSIITYLKKINYFTTDCLYDLAEFDNVSYN